jgi:tetratricopeptide (TPR) repeat protein
MRRHSCFALLALCASTLAAADEFDSLLNQGRAAYDAADINTAAKFYEQACNAETMKAYVPARVAFCHHQLATIDSARNHDNDAERHYLLAIESWKPAGAPYATSWCVTLLNLGDLYRRQRRLPEAERMLRQAADIAKTYEQQKPELHPESLSRLGVIYLEMSRIEQALGVLKDAVQRFATLKPAVPAEAAYAWNGLGMVQLGSGLEAEGEASLRRAVALATPVLGEDHPETAAYQTNLALALIVQGQFDRATTLLHRAKSVLETRSGPTDAGLGLVLAELSASASGQKKFGMAEEYAQQSLAILKRQPQSNPTAIALASVNLADVYLKSRRLDEAERLLTPAIATERQLVPGTRLLADGLRRLADLRAQQHYWQAAQDLYRESIGIYERRLGANSPVLAPALRGYADARRHAGASKAEVRVLESRAKAVSGSATRS